MFITFEGCEGCGKSTQARLLYNNLLGRGIPCVFTLEPGGTPLGISVRDLLKVKRDFSISPQAELMLFTACRAQLVRDVIRPALDEYRVVVCDRYSDSTLVYQGHARGLNLSIIEYVNNVATDGLKPDLTILLDTQPELGLGRKRNTGSDRFDDEDISFHRKVREGYLREVRKEPSRWRVIPAQQPIEVISRAIMDIVLPLLNTPGTEKT
jgi:dTMP kinase